MTHTPLHDRVILRRLEEDGKSGNFIIPDSVKDKPQECQVVAVGKGWRNSEGVIFPLDVKVDDKVLIGKYSGQDVKIDGEDHICLREEEIISIITE